MFITLTLCNLLVLVAVFVFVKSTASRLGQLENAMISTILEESAKPLTKAQLFRKTAIGLLTIAGFPSFCMITIGGTWHWLSIAMATMLIIASILFSVAVGVIVSLYCGWGD